MAGQGFRAYHLVLSELNTIRYHLTSKTYLAGAFVVGALVLAPPPVVSDPDCWHPTNTKLTAITNNANSFIAFLCRYVLCIYARPAHADQAQRVRV